MTRDDIQKVIVLIERHWTPATQSRLDAKREVGRILDAALAEPDAPPVRSDLIDDDGENKGVRAFLSIYQGGMLTVGTVMQHMKYLGWNDHPAWAKEAVNEPLTKAGAQLWIRHLLSLESDPAPADSSVVWHSVGELEQAIADAKRYRWLREYFTSGRWEHDDALMGNTRPEEIDEAIDAAIQPARIP